MLFNIQRYSTHDGPGIRTVVFLKGCSLACRWCQNPESRSDKKDLLFDPRLCLKGCDLCSQAASAVIRREESGLVINRSLLNDGHCDALDGVCPALALTVCGEEAKPDKIMESVLRDNAFYQRSGGGVTLSGGEPFMAPELTRDLLERSKQQQIHTAVETCLHVPWGNIQPSLPYIDLFLADLKHVNAKTFKEWTKGSAKRVLSNLKKLAELDKPLVIRVPLVPGFNADEDSVKQITDFVVDELQGKAIHFLPYHTLGMNKYAMLGQPYLASDRPLNNPALLAYAQDYATARGLNVTLRG